MAVLVWLVGVGSCANLGMSGADLSRRAEEAVLKGVVTSAIDMALGQAGMKGGAEVVSAYFAHRRGDQAGMSEAFGRFLRWNGLASPAAVTAVLLPVAQALGPSGREFAAFLRAVGLEGDPAVAVNSEQDSAGRPTFASAPPPPTRRPTTPDAVSYAMVDGELASSPSPSTGGQRSIGGLLIKTDPPGAEVWLDHRRVDGKTPLTVDDLPVGPITIRVRRGWEVGRTTADVVADAFKRVSVPLHLPVGKLKVISAPPEAEVLLDGAPAGAAPLVLSASAGTHEVVVSAEGHVAKRLSVTVEPGKTVTLRVELDPVPPRQEVRADEPRTEAGMAPLRSGGQLARGLAGPSERCPQVRVWSNGRWHTIATDRGPRPLTLGQVKVKRGLVWVVFPNGSRGWMPQACVVDQAPSWEAPPSSQGLGGSGNR